MQKLSIEFKDDYSGLTTHFHQNLYDEVYGNTYELASLFSKVFTVLELNREEVLEVLNLVLASSYFEEKKVLATENIKDVIIESLDKLPAEEILSLRDFINYNYK